MIKLVQWMNRSKKVAWLYLATGIAVTLLGIYICKSTLDFVKDANRVQGVVSDLTIKDGSFYPVVNYQDAEGKTHELNSRAGCKPACYQKGETVAVLYSKGQEAKIDSFFSLWGITTLLLVVGSGFVITSLFQLKKLKSV